MKTIPISNTAHKVWKGWCKTKDMTSEKLMDALQEAVFNKKRNEFYLSLPHVCTRAKALEGKKIDSFYKK